MTNKQLERRLAQAWGALRPKTDFDTVVGFVPTPVPTPATASRPRHIRRYVATVAAAAVMVSGVGVWWYTRPERTPPIAHSGAPIGGTVSTDGSTVSAGSTTIVGGIIPTDNTFTSDGTTVPTGKTSTTNGTVIPTQSTTVPTHPIITPPKDAVASLEEAKAAIAQGRYEAAYLYLLTDNSEEAVALRDKFFYVPVGMTDSRDGEIYTLGSWTYDEMGFPDTETVCDASSGAKKETKKICTYDIEGHLKSKILITLRDGVERSREEYTYTYDAADRLVRMDYNCPTGYAWQWTRVYTYDDRGNCVREEFTDDKGQCTIITSTYNEADQPLVILESYVEENGWHKKEYTYDADGNVLTDRLTTSNGTGWTYMYTYENGVQTSYLHTIPDDPNHWQRWYLDGTKTVYEYSYGNTGRYDKTIVEGDKNVYFYSRNGRQGDEKEIFYDENGNPLIDLNWTGKSGTYILYTYDDKGNCVEKAFYSATNRNDLKGSATLEWVIGTYTYVYDAAGRVLEQTYHDRNGTDITKVYAYDAAGRITRDGALAMDGTFIGTETTYNAAGLVLTQKKTYSKDTWTSVSNTYDAEGRIIAIQRTKSDGTRKKGTYDSAGNLLTLETNDGLFYACTWELRYYPDGLTDEHRAELEAFRDTAEEFDNESDVESDGVWE